MISTNSADSEYEAYLASYGKSYNSVSEFEYRKSIFYAAKEFIEAENAKGNSYTLGLNKFADWTLEEFKQLLGYRGDSHCIDTAYEKVEAKADETIDWEAKGAVSHVKNQGSCGSCWTFSAVGSLEGAHAIASGFPTPVQEFSEQQLVDCADNGNYGCNGGEMYLAFEWYQSHGACFEEDYPYTARDGTCKDSSCSSDSAPISDSVCYVNNDPSRIHSELEHGPLALGVAAGNQYFMYYKSGVLDNENCSGGLDHGVLLAGYIAERDAWKVKNSWGPDWGESGYIYLKDNHKAGTPGVCGVNEEISRPIL